MKKFFKYFAFIIIAITLVGCSGGNNKTESTDVKENSTKTSSDDQIIIKYGMISSETHTTYLAAEKFAQEVDEKSDGRIKVEIYPNGQLGGDLQLTESTSNGVIQMSLPATTVLTSFNEIWGVLDMPYLFNDAEKAFEALDGEVGDALEGYFDEINSINLCYEFNGIRNVTNNIRPINKPEDLKGIKLRVMESPVFIDTFTALGTNPTPMSFNELFTGLQQGTVDGQENPASLIYESKFNEVQKYFSETKHCYNFCPVLMNKDFYNSLSEEDQKIIQDAAKTWLKDWQRNEEVTNNDKYIEKIAESGVECNKISDEDMKLFNEKVQPVYDKYQDKFGDILEIVKKYQ